MMFWLLAALIGLIAVAGLALPWWWSAFAQRRTMRLRAANVAAYRTRLTELEADVAAGVVRADSAEAARAELGARLLVDVSAPAEAEPAAASSRATPLVAIAVLLAFVAAWYAGAGTWRTQALIELSKTDPEAARQASLNDSIARLRDRVADRPDDAESWVWLARSYRTRGSHAEAAAAFARANELRGHQDPDLLVEEGEALAQTQDRSMAGAPAERFNQALALAPAHPQALWYTGIAAMQSGDNATAIARWEQLLQQPVAEDMRAVIEHSLARMRGPADAAAPRAAAPPAALQLKIEVSVAPELASGIQPGDVLFVFAQDPAGPPMPLAVQRLPAAELPLRTTLDDSNSLMPTKKLSAVDRWRIVARISRTGSATPSPGDLEGSAEVGRADAGRPVRVVVSRRR